jgi:hypothetical protein
MHSVLTKDIQDYRKVARVAATLKEFTFSPHHRAHLQHDEDVGKDDGGVELKASQRLECYVARQVRRAALVEEIHSFARGQILRKFVV